MALLKEDGSLDVERINQLPIDEYIHEIENLTNDQFEEYSSKRPINECKETAKAIFVDYTLEEDIERNGLVEVDEFLDRIMNEIGLSDE